MTMIKLDLPSGVDFMVTYNNATAIFESVYSDDGCSFRSVSGKHNSELVKETITDLKIFTDKLEKLAGEMAVIEESIEHKKYVEELINDKAK